MLPKMVNTDRPIDTVCCGRQLVTRQVDEESLDTVALAGERGRHADTGVFN